MKTTAISNMEDVIDSRDVIARIEELTEERSNLAQAIEDANQAHANGTHQDVVDAHEALATWDEENGQELKDLTELAEQAEGYASDWKYGETLIRDSYFTEYAMELLSDIGDLPKELPHYIVIDEEATARNIQADYTAVEFGDVTYWIR